LQKHHGPPRCSCGGKDARARGSVQGVQRRATRGAGIDAPLPPRAGEPLRLFSHAPRCSPSRWSNAHRQRWGSAAPAPHELLSAAAAPRRGRSGAVRTAALGAPRKGFVVALPGNHGRGSVGNCADRGYGEPCSAHALRSGFREGRTPLPMRPPSSKKRGCSRPELPEEWPRRSVPIACRKQSPFWDRYLQVTL